MPVEVAIALALPLAALLAAFWRGGDPERIAAVIIAGWIFVDLAYHARFGPSGFVRVDPVHIVLDGAELVAISWLALRANRLWPLWAAAAQLICVSGHLAALIEPGGMRRAYWAITQVPQYIQLLALLVGVISHARRTRVVGRYRSWRLIEGHTP